MALRHRDIMPTVVDRENLNARPSKAQLTKQISLSRRPALTDIDNKIDLNKPLPKATKALPKATLLKPDVLKPAQPDKVTKKEEPPHSYSSVQIETAVDQDAKASRDPQMVSEYVTDIYQYLRELEIKYPLEEDFLKDHKSSSRMRAVLVNWLVQVHTNFGLCLETLHLCVSIIDRYLEKNREVGKDSLQLVGASALLVACKYEEMYLPDLEDFVFICDNAFSKRQILQMEMSILISLECNLGKPLSIHFLRRFDNLANVRMEHHNFAKYILELALLDHKLSHIRPSLQAAAACCLSVAVLSNLSFPSKFWTPTMTQRTGFKYSDFKDVVVKFAEMLLNADQIKHQSIQSKYSESKYSKISLTPKQKGSLLKKITGSLLKP